MDSTLEGCFLVVYVDNGTSQNEDFACYNPPSVTLVSFGCCVLLAVSLTGWCRWLVGGAFTCVHCWYFPYFKGTGSPPVSVLPVFTQKIAMIEEKYFFMMLNWNSCDQFNTFHSTEFKIQNCKPYSYTAADSCILHLDILHSAKESFFVKLHCAADSP